MTDSSAKKQPVLFISHGAGPSFFLSAQQTPTFKGVDKDSRAAHYLHSLAIKEEGLNLKGVKAILVVSAHWEERVFTVQTTPQPDLYFDYYGFPPETYKLTWPAVGAPDLANQTRDLLESKGIKCATDRKRGYDHGVFIPLMLIYPQPTIPVFQLSLDTSLSTERHLLVGEALADLRQQGILIIGSGFTTHRFRGPESHNHGKNLQNWMRDVIFNPNLTAQERRQRLVTCDLEPSVREAHPRMEHFLPLLVAMGAAGYSTGKVLFSDSITAGGLIEHYTFEN